MRAILRALDEVNRAILLLIGIGLMVITAVVFWQVMVRFVLTAAGINISSLELSRLSERGEAMMFVSVDDAVTPPTLQRIRSSDGIIEVRVVDLPPER